MSVISFRWQQRLTGLVASLLLCSAPLVCAEQAAVVKQARAAAQPLVMGEQFLISSAYLTRARQINVSLPTDYQNQPAQSYPLIVVLDGGLDQDFPHLAGLAQFLSFPWLKQMPASIVVGLSNDDRKHDFTFPSQDPRDLADFPTTGGSAQFIQFITEGLLPELAERYRINEQRVLIGQSLGGLLASEILQSHTKLFSHYLIVSPSLWWDNGSLLKRPLVAQQHFSKVFVAVGKEGEVMEGDAQAWHQKLQQQYGVASVAFQFYPELNHGDTLHLAAYDGLKWLFSEASQDKAKQ
ncbi:alpha/beta hydrolase [Pseudoalteromonas fenneropenaei]|uniref:Alpha/beta hydrolase n=1 Tax=Pseudoalteromonas fenneropenaei TaxID=1737459 RepID=A0ABV7CIJ9_9GAMM